MEPEFIARIKQVYETTLKQMTQQFWTAIDPIIASREAVVRANIKKSRERLAALKRPYPQESEDADCRALTRVTARIPFQRFLDAALKQYVHEMMWSMASVHAYFEVTKANFDKMMAEGEADYKRILELSRTTGFDHFGILNDSMHPRVPFTFEVEGARMADVEETRKEVVKNYQEYINEQFLKFHVKAVSSSVETLKTLKEFNYTNLGLDGRSVLAYCYNF